MEVGFALDAGRVLSAALAALVASAALMALCGLFGLCARRAEATAARDRSRRRSPGERAARRPRPVPAAR